MFLLGLKLAHQGPPLVFGGFSCRFVKLEPKFNAKSLLLYSAVSIIADTHKNGVKKQPKLGDMCTYTDPSCLTHV